MATRVYFVDDQSTKGVTPASWLAGWNAIGVGTRNLCASKAAGSQTGNSNNNTAGTGVSGQAKATTRWIIGPLATQTISGTVKGQAKVAETNATDNYTVAIGIKVVKPDGTDRGVLLAVTASDDTSATPPECAVTTRTNRPFLDAAESASIALSSVDAVAGDYLVVERGFRQASTSVANFLDDYGFLSSDTDLGENDTSTSATEKSWLEFSNDLKLIEYFGSATTPADGTATTNTADPTAVTPPAGMLAGDLVLMIGSLRTASVTPTVSQAGGQAWASHAAISGTNRSARLFSCTFNGTWSADPSVSFGSTTNNNVQMHVFRPPTTAYTWAVNQALVAGTDATDPFTITGQTTTGTNPTVTIAGWFTPDDNTWGALAGTGWEVTGLAQYRNTSGSDTSATYAHKIQVAAGATGNVEKSQLTLGADTATTFIVTGEAVPPAKSLLWNPYAFLPHLVRRVREWFRFKPLFTPAPSFRAANDQLFKKAA